MFTFIFVNFVFSGPRTCDDIPFCTENLGKHHEWFVDIKSINLENNNFSFLLKQKTEETPSILFYLYKIKDNGLRFRAQPVIEENYRYDFSTNKHLLSTHLLNEKEHLEVENNENDGYSIIESSTYQIKLQYNPFKISISNENQLIYELNSQKTFLFDNNEKESKPDQYEDFEDTVPHGSTSVSIDIKFITDDENELHFSGLPERPSLLNLETETEPIRLFNTDGYEYDAKTPVNLYGSIPFLLAHNTKNNFAVFWMNPTDTFVKISEEEKNCVQFLSEGGFIDFVLYNEKNCADILKKYTDLSGKPMMPPAFSLGYHQSRWGYMSTNEVNLVIRQLIDNQIPFDSMWLDLDHLVQKIPFTHNPMTFGDIDDLMADLEEQNRYLIRVSDPHFPNRQDDPRFKDGRRMKLFVTDPKHMTYIGDGWPGSCAFPDFMNPACFDWWARLYNYGVADISRENVFPWNDMNEPSIFKEFEQTFPKDNLHYNGIENREVHNIYGAMNSAATYKGVLERNPNKDKRPFVLSRSFFSGSQKYAFVWTGDNTATWDQLAISVPMILSQGISGLPYTGADVGGFLRSPDELLLARWFQLGAWCYPFFREHCHHKSRRREPIIYQNKEGEAMKQAIQTRYRMLPLWYTAAHDAHETGVPLVRPLFFEFPDIEEAHINDNSFMLSSSILISPVLDEDDEKIERPELPGLWYTFDKGTTEKEVDVTDVLNYPVFIRGGSIIPTFSEIGMTAYESFRKPLQLIIALDEEKRAHGKVYLDDGVSFAFQQNEYLLRSFNYENGKLNCSKGDEKEQNIPEFLKETLVESVIIMEEGKDQGKVSINKKLCEDWSIEV